MHLDSGNTQSQPVSRIEVPHLVPLVQPESKTIILFITESSCSQHSPNRNRLVFSRYTYSGERIGTFFPSLPEMYTSLPWGRMTPLVPVDDSGTAFATRIGLKPSHNDFNSDSSILLRFDEKTYEVTVLNHPVARQGPQASGIPMRFLAWWKDTCYGFTKGWSSNTGNTLACVGTRAAEACTVIISGPLEHGFEEPPLLNEKYVIAVSYGSLFLLCFHESSNRPKEDGTFFNTVKLEIL